MKAITIFPEWCWAITKLGKNVENRTWKPPRSVTVGTRIAIHAGGRFGGASSYTGLKEIFAPVDSMARRAGWRVFAEVAQNLVSAYSVKEPKTVSDRILRLPRGAVVAVATFSGILNPRMLNERDVEQFPWWAGDQFGWVLSDVDALDAPVECRGRQGLWNLPADVEASVLARVAASSRKVSESQESSRDCGHK
jgi:hypothetical protein